MKRLTCNIKIGSFLYFGVVDCNIESSYETLTDTCKITFPRKVFWNDTKITSLIKRGDAINVELGYNDENTLLFSGFIKTIKASVPIEITCEDSMYLLKQSSFTKSYKTISLRELLTDILPVGVLFETIDFSFTNFRITNATVAEVLNVLNSDFGLRSFFKNGKLYVGLNIWADISTNHIFVFQRDIIDQNSLEFQTADEIKLKVVAVSIDDNNNRTTVEVGDKDGEQRTFNYYNLSKSDLETVANTELQKLKYNGYKGSFSTFGTPVVKHGDTVTLIDRLYPEREGTYSVKAVNTGFGTSGYRQTVFLDRLQNGN